jgi:hypothetical protein
MADLNQSVRASVDMVSRDLSMAGYKTPPTLAVLWSNGSGGAPDELTIVYADPDIPTSRAVCKEKKSGCKTIGTESVVNLDIPSLDPAPPDPTQAYGKGMVLMAIETEDCNGDGQVGFIPFEVTKEPSLSHAGGIEVLQIIHNQGGSTTGINPPEGFNGDVQPECSQIGFYHFIQYRVDQTTSNPILERRDMNGAGGQWYPVAANIENFQVQFGVGTNPDFVDSPAQPNPDDPSTWIMRVKVTVAGRSESENLQGSTERVYAADDSDRMYVRKTLSTTVSLRNLSFAAANQTYGASYN